jgi:hypothetical protein
MSALNHRISALAVILMAFVGTWLTPARCEAQLPVKTQQVPYYQVQVLYEVRYPYSYGPLYTWKTILETEDYEEAEFVYALYLLAQEQGILDEVAPNFDHYHDRYHWADYTAIDVQMLTKYRSVSVLSDLYVAPSTTSQYSR